MGRKVQVGLTSSGEKKYYDFSTGKTTVGKDSSSSSSSGGSSGGGSSSSVSKSKEQKLREKYRDAPLEERPIEILSRGEKEKLKQIIELRAEKGKQAAKTKTERQLLQKDRELQKTVKKKQEKALQESLKDKDVRVEVEKTRTSRGIKEVKRYYDAKTDNIIAREQSTQFKIMDAPRSKKTFVPKKETNFRMTEPEIITSSLGSASKDKKSRIKPSDKSGKVIYSQRFPSKEFFEQRTPKQETEGFLKAIEQESQGLDPTINIDKTVSKPNLDFTSTELYRQETTRAKKQRKQVKSSPLALVPIVSFEFEAEQKARQIQMTPQKIDTAEFVLTGGGQGTKITYKPFTAAIKAQNQLDKEIRRTQSFQKARVGTEAAAYYVIGGAITKTALKFGSTGTTALRITDFADDVYDVYEGGQAIYSISKGNYYGGEQALTRLATSNLGARLGSENVVRSFSGRIKPGLETKAYEKVFPRQAFDIEVKSKDYIMPSPARAQNQLDQGALRFQSTKKPEPFPEYTRVVDTKPERFFDRQIGGFDVEGRQVSPARQTVVKTQDIIDANAKGDKKQKFQVLGTFEKGQFKPFRKNLPKENLQKFLKSNKKGEIRVNTDVIGSTRPGLNNIKVQSFIPTNQKFTLNVKEDVFTQVENPFRSKIKPTEAKKDFTLPKTQEKYKTLTQVNTRPYTYFNYYDIKTDFEQDIRPLVKPSPKSDSRPSPKPDLTPDVRPDIKPDVKPDSKPDVKPDVKLDIKPDFRPDFRPDPKIDPRIDPRPDLTPKIPSFNFPGSKKSRKPQKMLGFDVFVKEKGEFKLKTEQPLFKGSALGFGANYVENTPAATFKIQRSFDRPRPSRNTALDKFKLKTQFRTKKDKSDTLFIEKRKFRINTPGEIQGISKKGGKKSKFLDLNLDNLL